MTSADRRARERAELRVRILAAARELFARHGFEAVTLRKVAAAIEYAPAAIYGHFTDKEALVRELCLADFDELSREFARLAEVADPLQRIARAGRTFVRFAAEKPNHFRVMFLQHHPLPMDAEVLARHGDPARDGYAFLRQAVEQARAAGLLRAELTDADLLAQTFWAGVQGVVSVELAFRGDPWVELLPLEQRAEAVIDAMLRGLARPGVWPPARAKGARRPRARGRRAEGAK